jgi:hypothetical protein
MIAVSAAPSSGSNGTGGAAESDGGRVVVTVCPPGVDKITDV